MKNAKMFLLGIVPIISAGCCLIPPSEKEMSQVFGVHGVFGSNMVLQREKPIIFSGKAEPGKWITVQFNGKKISAQAAKDGEWKAEFPAMKAGGPYKVVVSGKNGSGTITFDNVMVGEVWICSGQSNMEMPVSSKNPFWRVKDHEKEVKNANHPNLRLYNGTKRTSPFIVQEEPLGSGWQVCTPKTVGGFSAAGYFFGRQLLYDLKVPVGLIHISWAGSRIEPWIPKDSYTKAGRREIIDIAIARQKDELIRKKKYVEPIEKWFKVFDSELAKKKFNGADPELDDSAWEVIKTGKSTDKVIGTNWYRKTISLPKECAGKDLILHLGVIDDADETYFNGHFAGSVNYGKNKKYWTAKRVYKIPGKFVKAGENRIAIRAANHFGTGGMVAAPNTRRVCCGKITIPLNDSWKIKREFVMDLRKYGERPNLPSLPSMQFPTTLFNGMVAPWTRYTVRGAIWYQGCGNAGDPEYYPLHKLLISGWREEWNDPGMPFIITQLAGFHQHTPKFRLKDNFWKTIPQQTPPNALTREIQAEMLKIPNTGLAVAIDAGDHSDVHPRDKQIIGFRLAREAERVACGYKGVTRGPEFREMKIEGSRIRVKFSNTGKGLTTSDGKAPGAFSIAGKDGKYVWAQTKIEGNDVIVWSPFVSKPVNVRYAFVSFRGDVNLCNKEGFPALPFRSDKPVYK